MGSALEKGVRLVLEGEGIEMRKYVVLPVDADHLVEETLELARRERGAEASNTARDD